MNSAALATWRRLAIVAWLALVSDASVAAEQRITTELREVRTASHDGSDRLTVRIRGHAGPAGCRGSVLTIERARDASLAERDLETVALAAMLHERPVMLTIPLDVTDCVEGKPTIADIRLLPVVPD